MNEKSNLDEYQFNHDLCFIFVHISETIKTILTTTTTTMLITSTKTILGMYMLFDK
jgi:hypothetical protein